MSLSSFLFAILALLLAPGPTNALMTLAGAQGGLRGVVRLIPAAVGGYLTAILSLSWLGADVFGRWPVAATILKVAAAMWVLLLAARLWQVRDPATRAAAVTARSVYVTTLLNPKAIVVALVLLPACAGTPFGAKMAVLILTVILAAFVWSFAGSLTRTRGDGCERLQMIQRIASIWLAMVSAALIAGALKA